jgi:hypothetical protein
MRDTHTCSRIRPGDVVTVLPAEQILQTLDSDGTLDGLPFMPEMLAMCGRKFTVLQRVIQACIDGAFLGPLNESSVRGFRDDDVVTLAGIRCSGADYGGCDRGCAIFWKEAWLRRVNDREGEAEISSPMHFRNGRHLPELRTKSGSGAYFCQSSELLKATSHLSGARRLRKCIQSVATGNMTAAAMTTGILRWTWWKFRHKLFGEHASGAESKTPSEVLNLQPGEIVEVKSLREIAQTLSPDGRNRGLHFSGDQRRFCGGRYRVRCRADNYIAEGSGEMKHFRNTVILDDVLCDSAYYAFGGCCRSEFLYWREIWLRRVNDPA